MRDREACQCFLEYLTQVTHCDENLLYLLQLENIKSLKSVQNMMEQTQSLIDTFVKLESPKELNITDKMRTRIIENFEEVKSSVGMGTSGGNVDKQQQQQTSPRTGESKMSNVNTTSTPPELSPELLWTKIQHAFHELTVQINLQLKQDSFESFLSSDFFEKFIIKKVREKVASHSQQHHEKTKKKRSSSTTIYGNTHNSPNLGDSDFSSSTTSSTTTDDHYNGGDSSDSTVGDNYALGAATLMKRFVGGLFKGGGLAIQQMVNHGNNLEDSNSSSSSYSEISSPILTSDTDDNSLSLTASLSSLFKHRGGGSDRKESSQNETVEIMKNIIQDLYKQLIQKDNEIKRLQEVLRQHGQLMGIGGERKAKPLPTAPKQQPHSQDDLSLKTPRKGGVNTLKTLSASSPPNKPQCQLKNISNTTSNNNNNNNNSSSSEISSPRRLNSTNSMTTPRSSSNLVNPNNNNYVASPRSSGGDMSSSQTNRSMVATTTNVTTTNSPIIKTVNRNSLNSELDSSSLMKQKKTTLDIVSSVNNKTLPTTPSATNVKNGNDHNNSNMPLSQRLQFFEKLSNNANVNNASTTSGNVVPTSPATSKRPQTVLNK